MKSLPCLMLVAVVGFGLDFTFKRCNGTIMKDMVNHVCLNVSVTVTVCHCHWLVTFDCVTVCYYTREL